MKLRPSPPSPPIKSLEVKDPGKFVWQKEHPNLLRGGGQGLRRNPFPTKIKRRTKDGELIVETALRILLYSTKWRAQAWACEFLRDTGWPGMFGRNVVLEAEDGSAVQVNFNITKEGSVFGQPAQ